MATMILKNNAWIKTMLILQMFLYKSTAHAKGKKGKAGEARQGVLTFAKAAARVELDAAIGGAEGSSSLRADLSHRGQGSVPAV